MPNLQRHAFPHEQLRDLAIQAKREGVAFDAFWDRAVRPGVSPLITTETVNPPVEAVVWPRDSADRANSMAAILGTEAGWRRCYEGVPETAGDRALSMLCDLAREGAGGSEERIELQLAA